jgi:DNA (cytosine-5)-methyltransferase 1
VTPDLTFGSLFSGIGGLELGLERAGWRCVWQSEIDSYASAVLKRHWPNVPNLGDITTIDWSTVERPSLLTGGYPCPAFSQAARGRNVAPDLWPHMRDAIAALRPRWVLLENVAAHLGRGFSAVLADLHALGFDAEWSIVTACSVGASHTRRRLFCVAHANGDGEPAFAFDGEVAWLPQVAGDRRHWGLPTADDVGADDGVPYRLDRDRVLGNAVVPQVAELIGRQLMAVAAPSYVSTYLDSEVVA